jgi:hypothetical protein
MKASQVRLNRFIEHLSLRKAPGGFPAISSSLKLRHQQKRFIGKFGGNHPGQAQKGAGCGIA